MGQSVSERLAAKYAELFVSVFDTILQHPSAPLVGVGPVPQCGIDGVPFRGANALLASMVASAKGYSIPSWMTMNRANDLGIQVRAGEHAIPVVFYDFYYEDRTSGLRDNSMTDAVYATLSDEDRKNWVKRCAVRCYSEFNISQTNFRDVYPDQWDELCAQFGRPAVKSDCPELDKALQGGWLCPVEVEDGRKVFAYNENYDTVKAPAKASYSDQERYYGDLAYALARSTGSEMRLERDINAPELGAYAREEVVCELAGATVATVAGVQSCMQEHNLASIKSWIRTIQESPEFIYGCVNEAAKASELICSTLGLEQRKGFNLQQVMNGVEGVAKAREENMERREKRRRELGSKHRKGWTPVKSGAKRRR